MKDLKSQLMMWLTGLLKNQILASFYKKNQSSWKVFQNLNNSALFVIQHIQFSNSPDATNWIKSQLIFHKEVSALSLQYIEL